MVVFIISLGVFVIVTGGVYLFTESATRKQPALTDRLDRITGSFTQAELTGNRGNVSQAAATSAGGMWDPVAQPKGAVKGATPWQKEAESDAVYANVNGTYVPFSKQKADSLPGITQLISTTSLATTLRRDILRAGLKLRPAELIAIYLVSGLGCSLIGLALFKSPLYAIALFILGFLVPNMFIKFKQSARKAAFEKQLPDILTLLSSSLRTGFSFTNAIQMVVNEAAAPASEEFSIALAETSLGVNMDTSLERMVERTNSYDLDLMATAVTIQLQVGGNLAEILDTISATIRQRAHLRMEISSLTAEGKLSGFILFLMPFFLALFIWLKQPSYFAPLIQDPLGLFIIIGTLVLQLIGGAIIYKMVNIDV